MRDATLQMPFDQYQRYRLVADILERLRHKGERLAVLDVGGRTALLRQFLPKDRIFLVDVEESEVDELVLGDGSRLPYQDDCVDAVVTFDTLEHVPPAGRAAFLAECRRVAKRWVVVAGPYDTEGVAHAESLLEDFLHEKMGVEHRYLAEHKENGLPQLDETEAALGGDGAQVFSLGHAGLARWLGLMCLELYMDRDPQLRDLASKYYEFYNGALYASDHAAPVYRHAVIAVYDGTELPAAEDLLDRPIAPTGSFEPFRDLLETLIGFDMQRDVITKEWERLEQVNADLHLDLDGHKSTLMILRENCDEQVKVLDEMRQRAIDLVSEEDLLQERIEDLSGEVSAHEERGEHLESRLQEFQAAMLEAERQAAAKQAALDDAHAALVNAQGEIESRDRALVELDGHRQGLEASLNDANVSLGEKQRSLDLVRGELTNQRNINEGLKASIRDRWANLLRAFGIK